jgi:hypothetical protein
MVTIIVFGEHLTLKKNDDFTGLSLKSYTSIAKEFRGICHFILIVGLCIFIFTVFAGGYLSLPMCP